MYEHELQLDKENVNGGNSGMGIPCGAKNVMGIGGNKVIDILSIMEACQIVVE